MSLEASVARFSDMSLKQRSRIKSCRHTAARELRPDDIVLQYITNKFHSSIQQGKQQKLLEIVLQLYEHNAIRCR